MNNSAPVAKPLLSHAVEVDFNLTEDYEKHPSVITLLFSKTTGVLKDYNYLQDLCRDKWALLHLSKNGNRMDLKLECMGNEVITLTGLRFDEAQLDLFLGSETRDRYIIFTVGKRNRNSIDYITTKQLFAPLLVTLG